MNKNFAYTKGKIILLMLLTPLLLVSINKVDVAAASPDTHFYVDPPEVKNVMPGSPPADRFFINISVTDAPETYAWEIFLSWDPALLELALVSEGDFLHRGMGYPTDLLYYPSLPNANAAGEIMIGCSLKGDVPWASGDGWLCRLGFVVKTTGSCVLNIYQTRLWDHLKAGLPTHTYYPNLDGFFYNVGIHDIAITSVTASLIAEIVGINVTVTNEGNFTETFDVTVYADTEVYNTTLDWWMDEIVVGDEITVGTKAVTGLAQDATTTLNFTWDIIDVAGGNYTISAEVLGDDDTRDSLLIDGAVLVAVHDIAITNIMPSSNEVTAGDNVTIDVTVENEGHYNETFDVTVYYDDTAIDTKTDIFLASRDSTTLIFTWDTADVAKGTYNITAKVPPVSEEEDIDDNTFVDGTIKVLETAVSDILLYAAVGVVIVIVVAAVAVYFIKFRKPT